MGGKTHYIFRGLDIRDYTLLGVCIFTGNCSQKKDASIRVLPHMENPSQVPSGDITTHNLLRTAIYGASIMQQKNTVLVGGLMHG